MTVLSRYFKFGAALLMAALTIGCAGKRPAPGIPLQAIYQQVHHAGSQDAVSLIREGMRTKHRYSTTDPYLPIRKPEVVIPIYRPARIDRRTGNRIQSRWEHAVVEDSGWAE